MKKKAKVENPSPLQALLPGAKIDSESGKISVNVGISAETFIFNVGGVRFETYTSTLYKQPNSPLANKEFLAKHYRPETRDYFFDRDPDAFKVVLNYLRTGELHLPTFICGPAVKNELEYWGIPDTIIERCCYSNYNSYKSTLKALNQLEQDRKGSFRFSEEENQTQPVSKLERFRLSVSLIVNQADSSITAKIYGIVSLLVVAISILSFLAESHPSFITKRHRNEVTYVYNTTTNTTTRVVSRTTEVIPHPVLDKIDLSCMVFFTVEYIIRIATVRKRIRYIRSLMGIIDLLALLPDYVQLFMLTINPELVHGETTKIITILKVSRILRVFRLVRHVPGLWILIYTLKASIKELMLMVAFLLVGMLIFSSLIFYADDRDTFTSIPHSFWWALITMTTVGYGDMYPVTEWGYVIGSLTAMSGLLMIGFSVPILVNNFLMYYKHVQFALQDERIKRSRHCDNVKVTKQKQPNGLSGITSLSDNNNKSLEIDTLQMKEKL